MSTNIFISKKKGDEFYSSLVRFFFSDPEIVPFALNLQHEFKTVSKLYHIETLENTLKRPRFVVIQLSELYIKDEWLMAELYALYMLEQSRNVKVLIPVLLGRIKDNQVPMYFKQQSYKPIDTRGFKESEGAEMVSKYIQKESLYNKRIFIGHGGQSKVWYDLRDFLQDRLHLAYEEFNRETVAGRSTTARLTEMLDNASFAFLIMTAEDEHSDQTKHARENVIHEIGLFQGRLTFTKAVILIEEGCSRFSNIEGLTYISFPMGNIKASFEKIREVLENSRIIIQSP